MEELCVERKMVNVCKECRIAKWRINKSHSKTQVIFEKEHHHGCRFKKGEK